tara:strand:+ start:371 stop:817 length:447 start_codon:yes stop_codon:yes gene_type:complete
MRNQLSRTRGFSLVEVLAAVGIIGIIAFLAIPNIVAIKEDSETNLAISRAEAAKLTKEAIDEGHRYSVVVMDLALPGGMSGLEATLAIKQLDSDAQAIVSSGYLEQNAPSAALEHGFAGILPKPYTADRLASELKWVVKRTNAAAQEA